MTTTRSDIDVREYGSAPERRIIDVDGIPMSVLVAEVADPRAVIVALHGGATDSRYFDCPGHPRNSLLRLGSALGFTVVAVDRPGYGASRPFAGDIAAVERRVDLVYGAVDRALADTGSGAGMFVIAHSVGCELGTRLAACDRGDSLLGLELSGTGREHQPRAHAILGSHERNAPPAGVRELLWTPEHLYSPELLGGAVIGSATPSYESSVVRGWPRGAFPEVASRVRVPVHFTAGEYEHVWRNDPDALSDIASLFTSAPRVEVRIQEDGGHNLSLGYTAPAYHLQVLAFAEECMARRRHRSGNRSDTSHLREGN